MEIYDNRSATTVIAADYRQETFVNEDNQCIVDCNGNEVVINNPTYTEVISLGDGQYLAGPKGDKGDPPQHEWIDTSLRFRNFDGTWGVLTDLKGDKGDKGDQGEKGPTGDIGTSGPPGPTAYVWAKYADSTTPAPEEMFDDPTDRIYVGLAYNREVPEGSGDPDELNYLVYSWSKIQGEDGEDGTTGATGPQGPEGPAGDSFRWIGEYPEHPTTEDLPVELQPLQNGDSYLNTTDQRVYTYSGGWHVMLESAPPGPTGPQGPQGAVGGGFIYQGEFATSPPGALVNWLYKNTNNQIIYMYDGTAWIMANSDGNATVDGVMAGDDWYFYCTYNDNDVGTPPSRPVLDGDETGWNPSPYAFEVGTINWCSQKISQYSDPNNGVWGDPIDISNQNFRGPVGFRGSRSIMVPIVDWDGVWDDQIASQAVGGDPQDFDIVTQYKSSDPNIQDTRRFGLNSQTGSWEWLSYNYVFLGDVLVDGSLDGNKINSRTTIIAGAAIPEQQDSVITVGTYDNSSHGYERDDGYDPFGNMTSILTWQGYDIVSLYTSVATGETFIFVHEDWQTQEPNKDYSDMELNIDGTDYTFTHSSGRAWRTSDTIFTSGDVGFSYGIIFSDPNTISTIAGMNGDDDDPNYADWRFWSGAVYPATANFRVNKDGQMWAVDASIEGYVKATSGQFTGRIDVGPGTGSGDSWWSYIQSGTNTDAFIRSGSGSQWRLLIGHDGRFRIRGADGNILMDANPATNTIDLNATVRAEDIQGDIVTARRYSASDKSAYDASWVTFDTLSITGGAPYSRTLVVMVKLEASATRQSNTTGNYFAVAKARMTGSLGTITSQEVRTTNRFHGGQGTADDLRVQETIQLHINIPANSTGSFNLQLQLTSYDGTAAATMRGTSGTSWVAQLFQNGSDLG